MLQPMLGARRDLVQLHTRPGLKLAQTLPGASLRARACKESSNARNRDLEFASRLAQLCVQAAVKQLVFKMKVVLALALGASALAPSQPKVRSSKNARISSYDAKTKSQLMKRSATS